MPDTKPIDLEPAYISIDDAARYTNESPWTVKELLRQGIYRAKKSGRRTLIVFASVKERMENLPDAKFAKPIKRRKQASENAEAA